MALKPWLDKARAAINNSDPTHDPDDDDAADKSPPEVSASDVKQSDSHEAWSST